MDCARWEAERALLFLMPTKPPTHQPFGPPKQRERAYDQQRGSARKRGYDARWEAFRKAWLAEHPTCAECERAGHVTVANAVDHVIPHRGDMVLFWRGPFQSMCGPCHNAKTGRGE